MRARAEPKEEATAALLERLRQIGASELDLWFTDLSGRRRRMSVSADRADHTLFSTGVLADGAAVGGPWEGAMLLLPDPAACYLDPAAPSKSLAVLCDVCQPGSREGHPLDPRRALKLAESYLRRAQAGSSCVVGAEPEFFLLHGGAAAPEAAVWEFLSRLARALGEAGIPADWFRTGPGAGQGRAQMRPAPALRAADQVLVYKHLARDLAAKSGFALTFLSKPDSSPSAGGMPVHHALWRGGANLFFDPGGWAQTSLLCRRYAAGVLAHAPALLAFCAPTTNSYRRLLPGSGAPTELILSNSRRTAACRIPAGTAGPSAANRRLKFCCPDASANPYLCFAAILMAGLDGIENALEPPLEAAVPPRRPRFPDSLEEALAALESDSEFLMKGGVFSAELIRAWVEECWRERIVPVRSRPHPSELSLEGDL